ncbi:MFS transporter [Clostridium sp. A1-XYC3]|uniref:MFS transporter n=1 Tax=Clostridium tanneri TaxID=3037988 RepID=A0ABU4JV13_9CLOT|nr:MFS transporter [Clostridium sp. A1-XYC3]MDW8801999.1 MFS transporter [Clostridium sp. A1-XYC3]
MKYGIPKMSLNRDILILLLSILILHIGIYIITPIFPVLLSSEKRLTAAQIGLVIGVGSLASQLGSVLGGFLSDRVGNRTTMVIGALFQSSALFGYGISNTFFLLLIFSIVNGIGGGTYAPTVRAAIASIASDSSKGRTTAFSLRGIAANIGVCIAGLLILFLSNKQSMFIFFTSAAIFLLLALVTWIFLPKDCGGRECPKLPLNSYSLIFKNRSFIIFTIISLLISAVYAQLTLLLPLRAEAVLNNGKIVGSIWTITSIIVIIFQGFISKYILQRFGPFTSLSWSVLFFGAGIFLIGLSSNFLFLTFSAIIFLIGEMMMLPTTDSLTSEFAHADLIGAYFSVASLISGFGTALGNFIGGKIISIYGINSSIYPWIVFAIAAIIISGMTFMTGTLHLMKKEIREL